MSAKEDWFNEKSAEIEWISNTDKAIMHKKNQLFRKIKCELIKGKYKENREGKRFQSVNTSMNYFMM